MENKNTRKLNFTVRIIVILATIDMCGMFSRASVINNIIIDPTDNVDFVSEPKINKDQADIRKKRDDKDRHAENAAVAGEVIAGTGGVIAAGSAAAGPFAPIVAGVGGVVAAVGGLTTIISKAADQSCREFGCHKGYCWSYCSLGNQWCYTTRTYSQSFSYIECSSDSECNGCWKCAGSCTL